MRLDSQFCRLSRRRALAAVSAGAGVAIIAGCGSRGARQGSSPSSGQGTPKRGGQIFATETDEPISFDPSTKLAASARGNQPTCEGLLVFQSGPSVRYEELKIQPALAEKWEAPDPQTYIYHLRNGVKWQNLAPVNGRALEAADVKWTYEYMARMGAMAKLP